MKRISICALLLFLINVLPLPAGSAAQPTKQKPIPKQMTLPKQKTMNEKVKPANESTAIYIPITSLIKQYKILTGHSEKVTSVAFSPDGKILASGSRHHAIFWDVTTGNKIKTLGQWPNDRVHSVAFSPDGGTLATAISDSTVILWDVKTGNKLKTLETSDVNSISFSPDGKILALGGYGNWAGEYQVITLWDVETGTMIKKLDPEGHGVILSVSFSPDGKLLASGSEFVSSSSIILWDVTTGTKLKTLTDRSGGVWGVGSVAFSSDGATLATAIADKTIILWDVATGDKLKIFKRHSESVWNSIWFVAFSPDGKTLASGSRDNTVILWDVTTGDMVKTLEGHSDGVNSISFSPDGKLLASGSSDKTVILWDVGTWRTWAITDNITPMIKVERNKKIGDISISPKGEFETAKEYEERVKIAKAEDGRIRKEYDAKISEVKDKEEKKLKEARANLHPISFNTTLNKYDADKEGFEIDVFGKKIFVNVPREMAVKVGNNKDKVNIEGMLKYVDNEKVELLNAFLVDNITSEKFAFGKHTETVITASTQTAPPSLTIQSIALFEPSGNGMLDAGETGKIKVGVKNGGKGTGFGVSIGFDGTGLTSIKLNDRTYIGTINQGEEKAVEVDVTAFEDIKTGEVNLKATLLESNGFDSKPIILAFKTKELMPPILQIAKVEIQDAEGKRIITKGRECQITLTIQNAGSGPARGIVASIESGNGDVKVFGDSKIAVGVVSPGESKKVVFSIAVTQRYIGGKTLPVSFSVKEERERFSINPDIKLALNEEAPDVRVVKVEARETSLIKAEAIEDIDSIPALAATQKMISENDVAVVIGIERYQGIPKSDYSYGDAKLVKGYLVALGFKERNIEFITDEKATQSSIKKTVETWLPNRSKSDSKVVIYYSGHGAPDPKTGDAYIVPFDGDPNYLEDTGYSLKRLYDKLGKLGAAEVVVLLDSCFSGAGGRSVLAKGARPLVMMTEGGVLSQNMAVLSATQGSQISASSPEKGHGVFTYYFLKALKDGKKTIAEIYEYIKPRVEDEAKQLNVQQSPSINPDAGKLKGRFSLRK